jgi:hypothetical protein
MRCASSAVQPTAEIWHYVNATLVVWVMRKYKRYRGAKIQAGRLIEVAGRIEADSGILADAIECIVIEWCEDDIVHRVAGGACA